MGYICVALGIQAVVSAVFCAVVADSKSRSVPLWIVLGFLFGLYALVAIAGLPPLQEKDSLVGEQGSGDRRHREQALKVLRQIQEEKTRATASE